MNFDQFFPIIICIIILFYKKFLINNFLVSQTGDTHQKFANKESVPLIGGILIFISFCYLFFGETHIGYIATCSLVFFIGFVSDIKLIKSAFIKLILQFLIIYTLVSFLNFNLSPVRINFLDLLNQNIYFNYFFITLCIVILINGSNFMDGINGLALGYFLLIFLFINLNNFNVSIFPQQKIYILIQVLLILFIFNLFNKLFLGDSGSYFLGVFYSFYLIEIYNTNLLSPFYIILLLWYPCFELLFSILRKFNFKKSPMKPDVNHLHQLIFISYKKKGVLKNPLHCNNLSSISILIYNFILFYIATIYNKNSEIQILFILISVILYCYIYLKLYQSNHKS